MTSQNDNTQFQALSRIQNSAYLVVDPPDRKNVGDASARVICVVQDFGVALPFVSQHLDGRNALDHGWSDVDETDWNFAFFGENFDAALRSSHYF